MSKRPTTNSRKECENATISTNSNGYVVIGDTAASTLYVKRLLGNKVTTPITVLSEGVDRTNTAGLTDVSFIADNTKRSLHYLTTEQLHMIPSGDNQTKPDDLVNTQTDQIIHYYIGAGPVGDYIAAYHIPRVGPWFTHSSSGRLEKFITAHTVKSALSTQELTVANKLKSAWKLTSTSSPIVKGPSILNCHYEFVEESRDKTTRQLFLEDYHNNDQTSTVNYASETSSLTFSGATGGLYTVTTNNITLTNVRPVWKTNIFTYLRLSSEGGLPTTTLNTPAFYRAVIPISVTGGVDLSSATVGGDLLSSHLTFSVDDVFNAKQSGLVWLAQCYTTAEDLSIVDPAGKYADTGKTLLIIEAVCTKNLRKTSYNTSEHEVQVYYNDRIAEYGYLKQFASIASTVYNAYTGKTITVDTLLKESSVCDPDGTCTDGTSVVDYSLRESPMVSVLELAANMYGSDIYPVVTKC